MFAQKKKKTKIWLVIPVLLALVVGIWLNAGLEDTDNNESNSDESAIEADSGEYESISDLSEMSEKQNEADSGQSQSGVYDETDGKSDEYNETGGATESTEDEAMQSGTQQKEEGADNTAADHDDEQARDDDGETSGDEGASEILLKADDNGRVIIYRYDSAGNQTSEESTQIYTSLLTQTDKVMFERGITVSTESELTELLESFDG